jgi:hypothetical protein
MLSKRLRATGVLVALCLAMSAAPAQASAPGVSDVRATRAASLLPEIGDEVLAHELQTTPHADGIIAILIGVIAPKAG